MTRAAPAPRPGPLARGWTGVSRALLGRLDRMLGLRAGVAERGGATVEFVLLLPAFLVVFISSFDASIMLIRQVMMERAVDVVVRDIRLDVDSGITQNRVRRDVCARARVLPDCNENMIIELTEIRKPDFDVPDFDTPCVNQLTSIAPDAGYAGNRGGKMLMLRACYSVRPALPLAIHAVNRTLASHLINDEDGTIRMVTATTFVVESTSS